MFRSLWFDRKKCRWFLKHDLQLLLLPFPVVRLRAKMLFFSSSNPNNQFVAPVNLTRTTTNLYLISNYHSILSTFHLLCWDMKKCQCYRDTLWSNYRNHGLPRLSYQVQHWRKRLLWYSRQHCWCLGRWWNRSIVLRAPPYQKGKSLKSQKVAFYLTIQIGFWPIVVDDFVSWFPQCFLS